ncbi:protein shifted isoform X5 [Bactrocera dorsalis]|nr:protein shifted isoform X5 [Bactrocera dorsalis]XP_049317740.1 protein shifted isoform X5 [Bactrocera dorsalis]XP_049317741.1 protein shifted isoform X5 [Bactrocera dorsalis]XP_049317742.1 protein shifted isoform X5 [Bactrocera dorsalis]
MFHHTQMSAIKWFYLISLMLLFCWNSLIECKRQQSHANDADHELRSSEDEGGGGGGGGAGGNLGNGHQQTHRKKHRQHDNKLSLWINEQQLNMLSALFFPQGFGSHGRIYAIENGHVFNLPEINVYKFLIIPAEVNYVNFTWKSGSRKYFYHFDRLISLDHNVLKDPKLSIAKKGRIPAEEKDFSIFMPCVHNNSGTAMFTIGLSIQNRREKLLPGTPIRLNFKKECAHRGNASISTLTSSQGPDPECNLKCGDNGFCNHNKICQCKAGYTGQYCQTAFCFPQCLNGGNCTAPSVCTCPDGYQGTYCEGGICSEKCLNGGKCIQKDKCQCSKGYYGLHCEFSKCVIPCKNGGRCIGPNICRCPSGLLGNHCEIERIQRSTCRRPCKHGVCTAKKTCKCDRGFYGRHCNARIKKHRKIHR